MTPKEYLKQTDGLNQHIRLLVSEVEELRMLSTSVSAVRYDTEKVNNGTKNTEAPFVRCLIKIATLEEKINASVDRLVELKMKISDAIDTLESVDERILLRARYVYGKSWEEIANQMKFSVRSVHRIHASALQHFDVPS